MLILSRISPDRAPADKEKKAAHQEVRLLQTLQHPNIVSYRESFTIKGRQLCIIMSFCEGGDLAAKIQRRMQRKQFFKEEDVLDWFLQMLLALQVHTCLRSFVHHLYALICLTAHVSCM